MITSRSSRAFARCCQLSSKNCTRPLSSVVCQRISSPQKSTHQRRYESVDASAVVTSNPKISAIVDQISQLTLLETADLVSSLKTRLNIPEMSFAAPAASAPAAGTGAAPVAEEEEAAPAAQEKTMFTLKLEKFDAAAKPKVIKEVKALLGLSLVDSKKFVESAPKVMKEGVPKEEAEKIIATMKALGAEVKMD